MAIVAVRAFRGSPNQPCVPQIAWYLLIDWPIGTAEDRRVPEIDGRYALELSLDGKYGWWPDDWIDRPWPIKILRG